MARGCLILQLVLEEKEGINKHNIIRVENQISTYKCHDHDDLFDHHHYDYVARYVLSALS